MAGEWIKVRTNLWDDPRVTQLCDKTGAGEAAVIGGLYWLWATADEHTETGHMPGLSAGAIDRKTGVKGLGAALIEVKWIDDTNGGITINRFDEHNGTSAKNRASTAKRVANHAARTRTEAKANGTVDGKCEDTNAATVSTALAREDKIREELTSKTSTPDGVDAVSDAVDARIPVVVRDHDQANTSGLASDALQSPAEPLSPSSPSLDRDGCESINSNRFSGAQPSAPPKRPECPHKEIIALYHEILPQCPEVRDWTPARATQLRARWSEDDTRQNLAYWRRFFEYVKSCPFLVGQANTKPGQKPFIANLEWLTKASNFTKVRERNYE